MMKKTIQSTVMVFACILLLSANNPVDYKFHSIYVYNFTKYIEWPAISSEFRIHILGGNATIKQIFEQMAESKNVGGSKIVVRQFNNINSLPDECDILFIPQADSHLANRAIEKYKGKSTLIVTERNGLIEGGSCINFVIVDNRLKFEISRSALELAGLRVSSQLLQMGIVK